MTEQLTFLKSCCHRCTGFANATANSFCSNIFELLSLHSTSARSSFITPVNGGWHKGHWVFLDGSSKARICVYRLRKGWAQGCGACSLLQCCLVCHLTVDCCEAIPQLSKQPCYIFHLKKLSGVTSVSDCVSLKPDGGFPINKCTGSIYTDCGTWRHNTHDTLFSGQSCHKSL